jgi:phenol 2-monooxygenase
LSELDSSLIKTYTPKGLDPDSVFDVRVIFQMSHRDLNPNCLPPLLTPFKGKYNLIDYEKVFCPNFRFGGNIFEMRGVNKEQGCIVVVRPDQHVSNIFNLDSVDKIRSFFDSFMIRSYDD